MVSPSENTVYLQGSRKHALDIENGLGRSFFSVGFCRSPASVQFCQLFQYVESPEHGGVPNLVTVAIENMPFD